ncbi:nucleotide disphospho-sugar-binding domain-containing protein [Kitasatospora sp. NPDC088134]|uniref:nucleotide disphospho-sugar-binding domain-containing protein n=1 Tax=Kitasatospora sp. NPDC088134 TaxID=3364071 RepID=UPI0038180412
MRVLFMTFPWESHFYPVVPVAWACRAAGHEVQVATMPLLTGAVTASGLPAVPVGPAVKDLKELFAGRSHLAGLEPGGWPDDWPVHPERLTDNQRAFLENMGAMQCVIARAMLPAVLAHAAEWKPDLIVSDAVTLAGPVAAAVLGIPNVRYQWGIPYLQRIERHVDGSGPLPEYVELHEEFGAELRDEPDAWLDPCPPSMLYPTDDRRLPMRYVPYNGPGEVPEWLYEDSGKPRVCLTWGGTMAKSIGADLVEAVGQVIEAAAGLDVEIVVAASPVLRDLLDTVPTGLRFAVGLPMQLLLPTCAAVVHHGGPGTTHTAVAVGTPQLAITRIPQLTITSGRLALTGAARHLRHADVPAGRPGAELIREELRTLLADPTYRAAAEALRKDTADLPSPADLVAVFERLAARA